MKLQLEETLPLLYSDTHSRGKGKVFMDKCGEESNSMVKVIEFGYHVLVVDKDQSHNRNMGDAIESSFVVGGYSITFQFYPGGVDRIIHNLNCTSLFIKNNSPKPAQLVYHIDIGVDYFERFDNFSSLRDRETYHELAILEPGCRFGRRNFQCLGSLFNALRPEDLTIRATIGVVLDPPPPPPPPPRPLLASSSRRCILFQVGAEARLHFLQESVVTRLFPSLLLNCAQSNSNHIVDISDVEPRVFKAVLWFAINKKLHEQDRKDIANNKDWFTPNILAAADRFDLKDLRRQCESFISYGDSEALVFYYDLKRVSKEIWENARQKITEFIPDNKSA